MNKELLRSVIAMQGHSQKQLAEIMGITQQSLSNKINEKNGAEFTQSEITRIKHQYKLTAKKVSDIFFEKNVS